MAGSCVWGVDREAIEQWGNTMCVFVSGFVWRLSWGLFFLGEYFFRRVASVDFQFLADADAARARGERATVRWHFQAFSLHTLLS